MADDSWDSVKGPTREQALAFIAQLEGENERLRGMLDVNIDRLRTKILPVIDAAIDETTEELQEDFMRLRTIASKALATGNFVELQRELRRLHERDEDDADQAAKKKGGNGKDEQGGAG